MITRPAFLPLLAVLAACGTPEAAVEAPILPAGTVVLDADQLAAADLAFDTVAIRTVALPVAVPGMLDAPDPARAEVGSIVDGRVEQVYVVPGSRVQAGDILVRIHSHELTTARRDVVAAEAAANVAIAAHERSTRLLAAGAVSREEVERRTADRAAAEGELARAREIVEHLAPDGDDVAVRAPTSGVVFAVHAHLGAAVLEGAALVELGDDRALWFTAWVPEPAVPALAPAAAARITLAAFPADTFGARLVRVGGRVDPARRAVDVRAAIVSPPQGARPGMMGTLHLASGPAVARAVLPADAVQRGAGGPAVFVVDAPDRFRRLPVEEAVTLADGTVAVRGLPAGLRVVTRGAYTLRAMLEGDPEAGHAH